MTDAAFLEVFSVAPWHDGGSGAAIGQEFARFPDFVPARIGPRDPARTKVTDFGAQLEALIEARRDQPSFDLMWNDAAETMFGEMRVVSDPFRWPREGAHHSTLRFSIDADDGGRTRDLGELFAGLCDRLDPYYGRVTTGPAQGQLGLFERAHRDRHPPPPLPRPGEGPRFGVMEGRVADVFWVQFFGPGYLAHWGADALDGVGHAQRRTTNGGLVIWATETPAPRDQDATGPETYAWKQPFYDAVGPDVFFTSDHEWQEFGAKVPTLKEHHRHLLVRKDS